MKTKTKQQARKISKLRFPEFSEEWKEKRLWEIIKNIADGGTPSTTKQEYFNGNIKWVVIDDIKDEIFNTKQTLSEQGLRNSSAKLWSVGTIILSTGATIGEVGIAMVPVATKQGIVGIVCKKKLVVNIFLKYWFQYNKRLLLRYAQGSSIKEVRSPTIKKFKISLPSLPEQQKIAEFLSAVDGRINILRDKREALAKYKKGIMQKIFPAKGKKNPEIRFKDNNGRDFPEWKEKRLGEIGEFLKGQSLSKNDVAEGGKNECVLYGELYTTYDEVINIVKSKTDSNFGIKSNKGDVLIPSSTTTSHIDLANATAILRDGVLLGGDINILRNTKGLFDAIFLAYYLTNHKKHEIARLAQGTTIVHLYYSHLKKLKISLPSLPEQQKIASFLSAIDQKIELVDTQIQKMQEWKKGLMQEMFV